MTPGFSTKRGMRWELGREAGVGDVGLVESVVYVESS